MNVNLVRSMTCIIVLVIMYNSYSKSILAIVACLVACLVGISIVGLIRIYLPKIYNQLVTILIVVGAIFFAGTLCRSYAGYEHVLLFGPVVEAIVNGFIASVPIDYTFISPPVKVVEAKSKVIVSEL